MRKKYEIMIILSNLLDDNKRKEQIKEFQNILIKNNVIIDKIEELGVKKLSYPIKKQLNGYYIVLKTDATCEAFNDFKYLMRINENVLRYLILVIKNNNKNNIINNNVNNENKK